MNRPNINETNMIKFSEVNTHENNDILKDIKLILYRLKKAGLKRAIIVDLTDPNIGIPVVRAIVPGSVLPSVLLGVTLCGSLKVLRGSTHVSCSTLG